MAQPRRDSFMTDRVRRLLYISGITWLTPLVGRQDRSDLEYLRQAVLRDLEWVDTLLADERNQTRMLQQVAADLAGLLNHDHKNPPGIESTFAPAKYPWHVSSG